VLLIYGSTTMGATVHLHYCMNEFVGWNLFHDKDESCGKCGMKEKDKGGCCKDEHKHFKLKVDHQKSNTAQLAAIFISPALVTSAIDFNFTSYNCVAEKYPTCHAPPDVGKERLHILNCVFLI